MTTSIHIVATGARTPLGLNAEASAAAFRAGISGTGEHPFMIDREGDPMPGALDAVLDPNLMGSGRILALAETAMHEACAPLSAKLTRHLRLPLFVALPEFRPGFTEQDAKVVQSGLMRCEGLPITISEANLFTQGHAAGLAALAAATEMMQQGTYDACLVGGVESYFQPDTMEWLDANRQLAGTVSRSGFVPGEGAGFCLLMTDLACTRIGLGTLARVLAVATARETKVIKTSAICLGTGLTTVVRSAAGVLSPSSRKINSVICDINGERYRGEEWGFVCLRLSQNFDDPLGYDSPADCWGDVGAASGPLFAMLACQAAARGYDKGPWTLLWASSEGGLRGAAVLEALGNRARTEFGHV
jgi:3-oxoacyl-[acyl-carrier-protein] synthase I